MESNLIFTQIHCIRIELIVTIEQNLVEPQDYPREDTMETVVLFLVCVVQYYYQYNPSLQLFLSQWEVFTLQLLGNIRLW